MAPLTCFPPIAAPRARVLILGTMPGVKSLEAQQYYAHPQNAFWKVLAKLFDAPADTYAQRVRLIRKNALAVWDVFAECEREGSLDTKIRNATVNDFAGFLAQHPLITHIFFNGTTARTEFMKCVKPGLSARHAHIEYALLPSTSPAMATLSLAQKVRAWRKILTALKAG